MTNSKSIVIYYDKNKYNTDIVNELIKKYGYNIKFSAGIEPYVTLKIGELKDDELIGTIKDFLQTETVDN